MRTNREVHAGITDAGFRDGAYGKRVIGVNADKDVVIRVAKDGKIMIEHPADHGVFPPERHKNSDPALGGPFQVRISRPGKATLSPRQRNKSDEDVVQSTQQNPNGQGNQTRGNPVIQHFRQISAMK